MYAPSSYNDTVTGETLSSVSEKSDSYSNEGSQPDYMVSNLFGFYTLYIEFGLNGQTVRQTNEKATSNRKKAHTYEPTRHRSHGQLEGLHKLFNEFDLV